MNTDKVWATTIIVVPYSENLHILDTEISAPANRAIRKGQEPNSEDLPIVLYPRYKDGDIANLPEFFGDSGFRAFSKKTASVLRKFDLGKTYLLPTKIVLSDRKTEVFPERGYMTMNRYQIVNALIPDATRNIRPNANPRAKPDSWLLKRDIEDDDIAVSTVALDAPPIWSPGNLEGVIFLRGDVVDALETTGVAHHWRLKRCRLVE